MIISSSLLIRILGALVSIGVPIYKHILKKVEEKTINIPIDGVGVIDDAISYIFSHTKADRIIIFVGTNGWGKLRYVTAYIERHKRIEDYGETNRFVRFEVDEIYKQYIKTAEDYGRLELIVSNMQECDLKRIYEEAGVTSSKIYFLLRKKVTFWRHLICYLSVATHNNERFTEIEKIIMRSQIERIRMILKN